MSKRIKPGDVVTVATVICNFDGSCTIVGNPEINEDKVMILQPGESFTITLSASS